MVFSDFPQKIQNEIAQLLSEEKFQEAKYYYDYAKKHGASSTESLSNETFF